MPRSVRKALPHSLPCSTSIAILVFLFHTILRATFHYVQCFFLLQLSCSCPYIKPFYTKTISTVTLLSSFSCHTHHHVLATFTHTPEPRSLFCRIFMSLSTSFFELNQAHSVTTLVFLSRYGCHTLLSTLSSKCIIFKHVHYYVSSQLSPLPSWMDHIYERTVAKLTVLNCFYFQTQRPKAIELTRTPSSRPVFCLTSSVILVSLFWTHLPTFFHHVHCFVSFLLFHFHFCIAFFSTPYVTQSIILCYFFSLARLPTLTSFTNINCYIPRSASLQVLHSLLCIGLFLPCSITTFTIFPRFSCPTSLPISFSLPHISSPQSLACLVSVFALPALHQAHSHLLRQPAHRFVLLWVSHASPYFERNSVHSFIHFSAMFSCSFRNLFPILNSFTHTLSLSLLFRTASTVALVSQLWNKTCLQHYLVYCSTVVSFSFFLFLIWICRHILRRHNIWSVVLRLSYPLLS